MDMQEDPEAGPVTPRLKPQWIAPEVERLVAGAAEGSSDISTDGVDIPS